MPSTSPIILDGGLSTALELRGADLSGSLWTAQLLDTAPDLIAEAHRDFFRAGAQVATTATYQASVTGFENAGMDTHAAEALIKRAVQIAVDVRDEFAGENSDLLVAASVGPYGATLADGSEYRGRYGLTPAQLRDFHAPRLELLLSTDADLLAVETIPDLEEAQVIAELLTEYGASSWLTYSVKGSETNAGQPLTEAYAALADCAPLLAVGVNCSDQNDVLGAVETAVEATGKPAIAYPNRGGTWDAVTKTWSNNAALDVERVDAWINAGATWVGGCCGISPDDIAALSHHVNR